MCSLYCTNRDQSCKYVLNTIHTINIIKFRPSRINLFIVQINYLPHAYRHLTSTAWNIQIICSISMRP